MPDNMPDDLTAAIARYWKNHVGMEAMVHPRELPYSHLEISTGAAELCMEAWNRDAHRIARAVVTGEGITAVIN